MMKTHFSHLETLRPVLLRALELDVPYSERPLQKEGRPASVLILLAADAQGAPAVLMTRRTETVETHKGQMAFPGGMAEPDEQSEEGTVRAALRETEEEMGIPGTEVEVQGRLPPLWTVTGFWVTPVVGILRKPLAEVPLRVNPAEIAEAFWIPFDTLIHPDTYRREHVRAGAVRYPIHVYQVNGHRIWGATGAMLKNFLDRLHALGL